MEDKSKQARVVERMLHIRDARAALKAAYEAEDKALRTQYERGEAWLLNELHATGAQSMKFTAVGATIYETSTLRAGIADWPAFSRWVVDNDELDMLQRRVSTTTLKSFMDQNENTPPPGVTTSSVRSINIRRT
mgnify:CR=1 FL=1